MRPGNFNSRRVQHMGAPRIERNNMPYATHTFELASATMRPARRVITSVAPSRSRCATRCARALV